MWKQAILMQFWTEDWTCSSKKNSANYPNYIILIKSVILRPRMRRQEDASQERAPLEGSGLRMFGKSVPSALRPEWNEDSIMYSAENGIAMVLDGVGGEGNGYEASKAASEALGTKLSLIQNDNPQIVAQEMKAAFASAHGAALRFTGFTTATAIKIFGNNTERLGVVGHIGDSRAYHLREATFTQVTLDHSLLTQGDYSEEVARRVSAKLDTIGTKRDKERFDSPYFDMRNVLTRALGLGLGMPNLYTLPVQEGDRVILTTDGIHDNLTTKEILHVLLESYDDPSAALVDAALKRSREWFHIRKKPDDMSAIVIEILSKS